MLFILNHKITLNINFNLIKKDYYVMNLYFYNAIYNIFINFY